MLKESCGYTFLTIVKGTNNEGVQLHPYLISRGKDKDCFKYSVDGTNNFKSASLEQIIDMLIDGKFDAMGRIRMRYMASPSEFSNPALTPIFDKSELLKLKKTLNI